MNKEYLRDVGKISPSAATLNQLVVELAVESVLMTSLTVTDKQLGLICDKGEDGGTGASFVKLMTYYNDKEDKVDVTCFGIEHAGNSLDDAAKAIDHSLKLFEYLPNNPKLVFSSSTTDAGGGGVSKSLVQSLGLYERASDMQNYTYVTCCLHAMNLMLSVPCETLLGSGGLKKRTFLQVLHTAYTLKGLYPIKQWQDVWMVATGDD